MTATAWILAITEDINFAVGEFELIHLLPDRPVLYALPKAPDYCNKVLVWEGKVIPAMDLAGRLGLGANNWAASNAVTGIFAYRHPETGAPGYGALMLRTPPQRLEVSDGQSVGLPDYFKPWPQYAAACFKDPATGLATVVIRLNRLFLPKA